MPRVRFANLEGIAQYTSVFTSRYQKTDLKKSINSSPDLSSEPSHCDGLARTCLVTDWNLALEILITRPLMLMVKGFAFSK